MYNPSLHLNRRILFVSAPFFAAAIAAFLFFPRYEIYRSRPVALLLVAAIAGLAAFHPRLSAIPAAVGRATMAPSRERFGLFLFASGTLLYSALAWNLYSGLPVLDDDVSALFQARIFLSGRLWLPIPEHHEFFATFGVISGEHGADHMCSMYPLGHPLLLLPGLALGVPWLVMPLFGAGTCVLAASVGRILFDEKVGRLAGLLCLASPMFAEICSTHLNHAPTAFGALLATRGILLSLRRPSLRQGLLAGLGISIAFLCRPATAAALGLVLGIAVAAHPVKAWRSLGPLSAAAAVLACALAAHVLYTQGQTGNWRIPGHVLCMKDLGRYGFTPWFGPSDALRNGLLRTMEFGVKATGWPVAAFLPALLPLFRRGWRGRAAWLWLMPVALTLVYWFYFYYEEDIPARYLFSSLPALLVLVAAGCEFAADAIGVSLTRVVTVPAACAVLAFLPAHLAGVDDHFCDVEKTLPRVVRAAGIHDAVVFYDDVGLCPDRLERTNTYYATGFMRNALDFRGDVVYAKNGKESNAELARVFPGRTYYLYRYRRDRNLSELYREDFDPETGEPSHTFIILDVSRYVGPDRLRPSIGIISAFEDHRPPKAHKEARP